MKRIFSRLAKFAAAVPALPIVAAGAAVLSTPAALADHHADPDAEQIVMSIEEAHHAAAYDAQQTVEADLELTFGPMKIDATLCFTPSTSKIRMELADGTVILYDGTTAWLSPADAQVPGPPPRFHVLTWPYFIAAPYKLNDPGTHHTLAENIKLRDNQQHTGVKVTFGEDVGDTPDDWYIAVSDPETDQLTAMAYIVTFGKDPQKAEASPSVILYSDFEDFDGVPFATSWTFHQWDAEQGVTGEPKGHATLSNIRFVKVDDSTFAVPEGAAEATMPAE